MKNSTPEQKKELVIDLVVNGFLPWVAYEFLQRQYGLSDYHALLAVTVIPGVFTLVAIVRKGRPDLFAGLSLFTILLSLVLTAVSTDTRVLQVRESYITGIMGLVFVGSSLRGKPIMWLLAKHQARLSPNAHLLDHPRKKWMLGRVNAVWGWSFVLEFAFKIWMIENLTVAQVLAFSPVMFYGVTAITFGWTVWWLRRQARMPFDPTWGLEPAELAPKPAAPQSLPRSAPDTSPASSPETP